MNRARNFRGTVIPSATQWELHTCNHCPNLHMILFNNEGAPFAEAVFSAGGHKEFAITGANLLRQIGQQNVDRQNKP